MDCVRVIHHHEDGSWWAESPDLPGWFAAADTYAEARQLAEEGVRFELEREDVTVEHFVPADEMVRAA